MANEEEKVISPKLIDSQESLGPDRRLLIFVIIVPYIVLCATLFFVISITGISQERATLAASTILSPLGALAGGIIAYYFKSS
jgi:hypothetical protein